LKGLQPAESTVIGGNLYEIPKSENESSTTHRRRERVVTSAKLIHTMSEDRVTTFEVEMTCQGCANAVRNCLKGVSGVKNIDIDVAKKTVVVTGSASNDALLAALKKSGKKHTLKS